MVRGQRAPDAGGGRDLVAADGRGLARDVLVDAAPGGVGERIEGLERLGGDQRSLSPIVVDKKHWEA